MQKVVQINGWEFSFGIIKLFYLKRIYGEEDLRQTNYVIMVVTNIF